MITKSGEKLLYRVETAAELCDIGRTTFWGLISSGEIESVRIGRCRRVPADSLREWIKAKKGKEE